VEDGQYLVQEPTCRRRVVDSEKQWAEVSIDNEQKVASPRLTSSERRSSQDTRRDQILLRAASRDV
jgi:hypothetical protein